MPLTMKQWQILPAGLDRFRQTQVAVPTPGPGEALVRVRAVALNYRDVAMVDGTIPPPASGPIVPGSDAAGEVVALGSGVTCLRIGEAVIDVDNIGWFDGPPPAHANSAPVLGRLAEFVVVPAAQLVRAPTTVSAISASTLPVAGLTAWFALVEEGRLRAGQTVVVQGTGGVSMFAVQLAAAHGARVIVTSTSDTKLERAIALGASAGVNRVANPEWEQVVLELTEGLGADHVLEMAGGDNLRRSLAAVKLGGRISLIGLLDDAELRAPMLEILFKRVTLAAIAVGHRRALQDLVQAVDQLRLEPVVDRVYAFDDAPLAFDHQRRGPFGKVVIDLSD
ncbi:zinc-dependent alcohol dehydrogenase family protein [Phenylobacterium koreense]|uniref:NADPH:quinone reductase-like Zn-dependent oxidoreductase n=1 Tax=Phenylobacterium koreense TaxID=266125 RepID=A0ABV2EN75_9CAUL